MDLFLHHIAFALSKWSSNIVYNKLEMPKLLLKFKQKTEETYWYEHGFFSKVRNIMFSKDPKNQSQTLLIHYT